MKLNILNGNRAGADVAAESDRICVGSGSENDVVLTDVGVSREHAELRRNGTAWYVIDLGSMNGTYLNGEQVNRRRRISGGDVLVFGRTEVALEENGGGETQVLSTAEPQILRSVAPEEMHPVPPEGTSADHAATQTFSAASVPADNGDDPYWVAPTIEVVDGYEANARFPLQRGVTVLGRDPQCGVSLPIASLGRMQCRFEVRDGRVVIYDLNATNPTIVDGRPVKVAVLRDGARIQTGSLRMVFRGPRPESMPEGELEPTRPLMAGIPPAPSQAGSTLVWMALGVALLLGSVIAVVSIPGIIPLP